MSTVTGPSRSSSLITIGGATFNVIAHFTDVAGNVINVELKDLDQAIFNNIRATALVNEVGLPVLKGKAWNQVQLMNIGSDKVEVTLSGSHKPEVFDLKSTDASMVKANEAWVQFRGNLLESYSSMSQPVAVGTLSTSGAPAPTGSATTPSPAKDVDLSIENVIIDSPYWDSFITTIEEEATKKRPPSIQSNFLLFLCDELLTEIYKKIPSNAPWNHPTQIINDLLNQLTNALKDKKIDKEIIKNIQNQYILDMIRLIAAHSCRNDYVKETDVSKKNILTTNFKNSMKQHFSSHYLENDIDAQIDTIIKENITQDLKKNPTISTSLEEAKKALKKAKKIR